MAAKFGATSTTEDVLAGTDLRGRRILVTGVSAESVLRPPERLLRAARRLLAPHAI